jgi:hypothetical protein
VGQDRRQGDGRLGTERHGGDAEQQHQQGPVGTDVPQTGSHREVGVAVPWPGIRDPEHEHDDGVHVVDRGSDAEGHGGSEVQRDDCADCRSPGASQGHRHAVEGHRRGHLTGPDQARDDRLHGGTPDHEPEPDHQGREQDRDQPGELVDATHQPDHQGQPARARAHHRATQRDLRCQPSTIGHRAAPRCEQQLRRELHGTDQSHRQRGPRDLEGHDRGDDVVDPRALRGQDLAPEEQPEDAVDHQSVRSADPQQRGVGSSGELGVVTHR